MLPWMDAAFKHLGLKEIKGSVDEPKIIKMFADVGQAWVRDDETAWCAAYVGSALEKAGIRSSRALNARSYSEWGIELPIKEPLYGCVGVKGRHGGTSWQGHVGFVVGANENTIWMLGGNQSDQVSIAAFKRSEFIDFRWPTGVKLPVPAIKLPKTMTAVKAVREA